MAPAVRSRVTKYGHRRDRAKSPQKEPGDGKAAGRRAITTTGPVKSTSNRPRSVRSLRCSPDTRPPSSSNVLSRPRAYSAMPLH